MLPKLRGSQIRQEDDDQEEADPYELGLVDEEGNLLTAEQAKVAKCYQELDRQTKILKDLIQSDKNYKYVRVYEDNVTRSVGLGLVTLVKKQIDDFLVPPATRTEYEREKREMAKERAVQLALDKRKKDLFAEQEEAMKRTEADKKKDLQMIRSRLKSLDAPQVTFTKEVMNTNPLRGPMAAVPNLDYTSKSSPLLNYSGGRFQGTRQGFGTQVFANGDRYEGEWHAGCQEGFGKLFFSSSDEYHGQWHVGNQDGYGLLTTSTGLSYRGQWKQGLKHGYGEFEDKAKGTIFGGEWRNGKRNGFGVKAWLRTGTAFMGEWLDDKKTGGGLLRSDTAALGIGRFFTRWDNGILAERETYDALRHGTEVLNSATWASHYAAKAAQDAALVIEQKISYPNAPQPPERLKHVSAQDISEIPEHIQRFRETWMTKRVPSNDNEDDLRMREDFQSEWSEEYQGAKPKDNVSNGDDKSQSETETIIVTARAMRRLITLVHSADRRVEELVLPILNDAKEVKDAPPGQEGFIVGPVWNKHIALLEDHFASKIQRKWKSLSWRRAFKVARKIINASVEEELERQKLKAEKLEAARNESLKAEREDLVARVNSNSLIAKLAQISDQGEHKQTIAELLKKSKLLFGPEMHFGPHHETNDRWTFPDHLAPNLAASTQQTVVSIDHVREKPISDDDDLEVILSKYVSEDGMVYYGQMANKLPHGFGTASYPDGCVYAGQFSHGMRDGVGEYVRQEELQDRSTECTYVGEWRKNMRHGFAVEQCKLLGRFEQLLESIRFEYKNDEIVWSEKVEESACAEWLQECAVASLWAKRAALEARELLDEAKETKPPRTLGLSKLMMFSMEEGFSNYSGSLDPQLGRHGSGVQEWDDGHRYAGDWVNDVFEGFGREDYANGSSYTGQFKGGTRSGRGRFSMPEGGAETIYLGQWLDGKRNGRGIERREIETAVGLREVEWVATVEYVDDALVNLESFNHVRMREFVDDTDLAVRNGARAAGKAFPATRVEYPADKEHSALWYVGGRLDDLRSGSGVLVMRDGTRYIGDFLLDVADGYGVETYPDGSVYSGQFKNSMRHGFGKYVTARGMMHLGEWSNGLREGRSLQRSLVQLTSGSIAREYLVDFSGDEERERTLVKTRQLPWIKLAESAVKRAEETCALTVSIYQELLD